jgi:hypothetical protein
MITKTKVNIFVTKKITVGSGILIFFAVSKFYEREIVVIQVKKTVRMLNVGATSDIDLANGYYDEMDGYEAMETNSISN